MAISTAFKAAAHAAETDEVLIILLTITHPDTPDIGRVSSDPTTRLSDDPLLYGTVSRGNTFTYISFAFQPPDDREEAPPRAQIILDNVGREFINLLRTFHPPATLLVELVLGRSPDAVEMTFPDLEVVSADYDAQQVILTPIFRGLQDEQYPALAFTPGVAPGLFG
ncbi:MAG: DUF1833 family protein [Candidatus Rokuibacteriota bacterium]